MIFNLNAGNIVAKLRVKFPAGSVVTITSGLITLVAQNGSEDTEYTFMVPFPGDWVLTIVTADGITTTQTVSVTPGNDQSIAPTVKYYIFDKGHTYSEITGGWTKFVRDYGSCNVNTNYPDGYLGYSNGGDVSGSVGTAQAFTIPAWAKWFKGIGIDYPQAPYGGSVAPYWFMSLTPSKSGNALVTISSRASTKAECSADVSSIAGQTVWCGSSMWKSASQSNGDTNPYHLIRVYELWFESDTTI